MKSEYSILQEHVKLEYVKKFGAQAWYNLLDTNRNLEGITIVKIAITNLASFSK